MKTLLFDMQSGVAGDMTIAAALNCGIDKTLFLNELKKIALDFTVEIKDINRSGVSALTFNVKYPHQHIHRKLKDIKEILEESELNSRVKERALKIFNRLAEAEGKVHGASKEEVHFHEVGAVDSIVDIIGACIAFEFLEIDEFYYTPFTFGSGTVKCAHGIMAVPVPATVELTVGFESKRLEIEGELVTPTGAAIITALSKPVKEMTNFSAELIGYGAGTKEREELPNLLRIIVGQTTEGASKDIIEIETNIDDVNGEIIGYTTERLLENNALDVFTTPIYMKKNRPGILLKVICKKEHQEKLQNIILEETGTLGLRVVEKTRYCLPRTSENIQTTIGEVSIKKNIFNKKENIKLEYEYCKKLAKENKIPLREIIEIIKKEI